MRELGEARQKFSSAQGGENMRRLLKKHGTLQASPGLRLDGEVLPSGEFTRWCEEMDALKSEQLAWFENYDLIICPAANRATRRLDVEPPEPPGGGRGRAAGFGGGGGAPPHKYTPGPAGLLRPRAPP